MSHAADMAKARASGVPGLEEIEAERAALLAAGVASPGPIEASRGPVAPPQGGGVSPSPASPPTDPIGVLCSLPGGPTREQVETWKKEYPEIYLLPLDDRNIFVYRYLTNIEWFRHFKTQPALMENDDARADAIVQRCVLWPRLDPVAMAAKQAGLRDLLCETIMQTSYFLNTDRVLQLVTRL